MFNLILHSLYLDFKMVQYFGFVGLKFALIKYISRLYKREYRNIFRERFYVSGKSDISFLHELIIDQLYLKEYIDSSGIIVDIGANIGQFAFFATNIIGATKVYSFEPLPIVFDILKKNNPNSFNYAISDTEGDLLLYYEGSTLVASAYNVPTQNNSIIVKASRIQNIIDIANLDINLIKMDVEGAEFDILKSMPVSIFSRTKYLLVECSGNNRKNSGDVDTVINYLYDIGFTIAHSGSIVYDDSGLPMIWDILFVRK